MENTPYTCICDIFFSAYIFSLKCKILVDVHFLGSKIKAKLEEEKVKAPNIGSIYSEISQAQMWNKFGTNPKCSTCTHLLLSPAE